MNCGDQITQRDARRRRNALIGLTVFVALSVAMWSGTSSAGLPLYAQDVYTQLVNWGTVPPALTTEQRKLGEFIRDNAVFYLENGTADNDAPYFANDDPLRQVPSAIGHYVFYGNLRYSGSPYWVDPDREANRIESNFYHANDAASLTAWCLPDDGGVRLHWTPDLRFITHAEMREIYDDPDYVIPIDKSILRYLIVRHDSGSDVPMFVDMPWSRQLDYGPELFAFTDSLGSAASKYSIKSVPHGMADTDTLAFGGRATPIGDPNVPHFWAVKHNFQEPYYAAIADSVLGATAPLSWDLTFYVDQVLPVPANLVIERATSVKRNSIGAETIVVTPIEASYDSTTGKISCAIATQVIAYPEEPRRGTDWFAWGGVAYRLVYTPPTGAPVTYPEPRIEDAISRSRFMWTSINNRTLGCGWPNYMMNCEGDSWTETVKRMCGRLGAGITPPGAGENVTYSRLLLDVAMGIVTDHHNVIRPMELGTDASCRAQTVTNAAAICANFAALGSDFGLIFNTRDRGFIDSFASGGTIAPGFAGIMSENFTSRPDGATALADLLWEFRGHPYRHNILKDDLAFHIGFADRKQATAVFMMASDPTVVPGQEPRATFGYGEWWERPAEQAPVVPIFPEQTIGVLGPTFVDPFAETEWPDAASWASVIATPAIAKEWLRNHTLGFVYQINGRRYAVGRWQLDDGLPSVANEVVAVFDFGTTPGTYTLAEMFSDSDYATWHKLEMDDTPIVDGGVLMTTPISPSAAIPTNPEAVEIYFSAPVHSPVVDDNAFASMPANGGRIGVLKIKAEHWNHKELAELRVNGSEFGWGAVVQLHDADRDGVYCSELLTNKPEGVQVGVHPLEYVAVGNDGLISYGEVALDAVADDVLINADAPYPLLAHSYDGKFVLAVNVTSFVPLNATAPVEVIAPTIFGSSTPVLLWDDGEAGLGNRLGAEDAVAGDGIFTSDRVPGVVSAAGTHTAHVVVHPASGAAVEGDVTVPAVLSRAEFLDKTAASGNLQDHEGVARYAMAYGNTSSDHTSGKKVMVVTFGDANTAPLLLENQGSEGAAANFFDQHTYWMAGGVALPAGSRGICFGDFGDGIGGRADGKQDFFLCGATGSHLYANKGTVDVPQFEDVTVGAFPLAADRARIAGAVSAAWSDFNLDGALDLYVATSDYGGPMSEIGSEVGVTFGGAFFTNDGNGHFSYKNVGMISGSESGLTGVWAKLIPARKWPYLVLPWISSGNSMLAYCFDGGVPYKILGVTGEPLSNLNSIAVCDYNHDKRPDLVVTDHGGGGKAAILRNDLNPATGVLSFHVACTFGAGRIWNGATVADFDGNGQDDILLLPESGPPALFMAQGYSTQPEFVDMAFTLGLRDGMTSGCVATDMGGSRLADICFGRKDKRTMYENVRNLSGPDPGRWIEVSLGTVGNSNSSLIGAEVTIQQSGRTWTKFVDGGSGRGGQDPNSFRFFLEDDISDATVSVRYPSGDADSLSGVAVDSVYAVVEDTPITLKTGTKNDPDPTFTYEIGPGTAEWVFRWRTVGIKGDQRQDAVTIENYMGYASGSPCYMGFDAGTPLVLHWGDPGVTFSISWNGTDWVHEARWAEMPCITDCQYRFKVTSGIGNGVTSTSTQAKVMPALEYCLPED